MSRHVPARELCCSQTSAFACLDIARCSDPSPPGCSLAAMRPMADNTENLEVTMCVAMSRCEVTRKTQMQSLHRRYDIISNFIERRAVRGMVGLFQTNMGRLHIYAVLAVRASLKAQLAFDLRAAIRNVHGTRWMALHLRHMNETPFATPEAHAEAYASMVAGIGLSLAFTAHTDAERQRAQNGWHRLRRVALCVGRVCAMLRFMYADVHFRPGGHGAQRAHDEWRAYLTV